MEINLMTKKIFYVAILAIAIAALLGVSRPGHSAANPPLQRSQ